MIIPAIISVNRYNHPFFEVPAAFFLFLGFVLVMSESARRDRDAERDMFGDGQDPEECKERLRLIRQFEGARRCAVG